MIINCSVQVRVGLSEVSGQSDSGGGKVGTSVNLQSDNEVGSHASDTRIDVLRVEGGKGGGLSLRRVQGEGCKLV